MRKIINLFSVLIIMAMIVYTGGYLFGHNEEYKHLCTWEDCTLNDKEDTDVFISAHKSGTDEYYVDIIHWAHSDWSKEKCLQQIYTHIKKE